MTKAKQSTAEGSVKPSTKPVKTKRARRLEHYLSEHLGWNTTSRAWQCKCGHRVIEDRTPYCGMCGNPMPKRPTEYSDGLQELEAAIKYALGEVASK